MAQAARTPWTRQRKPRDTQYNEKQEAILQRAAALFAENGFSGVSLNQLAESLNITKPTLYYYFTSKDQLLLEIKRRAQEEIFEAIALADQAGSNGLEKVQHFVRNFIAVTTSDFGRCLMTINLRSLEPGSRQKIRGREKAAEDKVIAFFDEGVADGSIKPQNVKVAYQALTGLINWIPVWYKPGGPVSRDEMAEQVIGIFVDGIRGSAGGRKGGTAAPRRRAAAP